MWTVIGDGPALKDGIRSKNFLTPFNPIIANAAGKT
jgi:hypothetical protein